MPSTSTSARPSHGFEDVLSHSSVKTLELSSRLSADCKPQDLKDRDFFRRIWTLAFGPGPADIVVSVVGSQEALDEWAPYRDKSYPSFVGTKVYEGPRDDEDEDDIRVIGVADRKLVVLLPGEYDWSYLWCREFTGTNTVVGIGKRMPTVYNALENACSMVDCQGKTCLINVRFEARAASYEGFISSNGQLRLVGCILMPQVDCGWEAGEVETCSLVQVNHGASLVAEICRIGPSSQSCIKCDGQCVVNLSMCALQGAGRGDRVQRMSKVTGQFPIILQGFNPAIAVSYAATIQVNACQFNRNHGYPLQFASKDEERGTVEQELLDVEPEEYARDIVNRRVEMIEQKGYSPSYFEYDLTTKDGKEHMYQELLAKRQQRKTELALKRTKGSVEITSCKFEQNATSPLLPDLPQGNRAIVEPWFSESSKMHELLDEYGEPLIEDYYESSDEADEDREAWRNATGRWWDDTQPRVLSPAATLFQSLAGDDGITDTISKHLRTILASSGPLEYFLKQRRQAREPFDFSSLRASLNGGPDSSQSAREVKAFERIRNGNRTAYGMLDDKEMSSLRESMRQSIDESLSGICDAMKILTDSSHVEELSRICWGRFTDGAKSHKHESRLVAEAGILALHSKLGGAVSPYRAEALVELMECDVLDDYIECPCEHVIPPGQCTTFVLGLLNDSVVTRLFNVLKDETASDHGRKNAGIVLMRLAFAKPDLRGRVIAGLSDAISDDSDLSTYSKEGLVKSLACLHARESADIVRDASMKGKVTNRDRGYVAFLRLVGLSIDLTDEAVLDEVNRPSVMVPRNATEEEVREKRVARAVRNRKEIAEHNATLRGRPPCNHCGTEPPKGEEFPRCTRCHKAYYCGRECQRAAWNEHKKVCNKKGSKK